MKNEVQKLTVVCPQAHATSTCKNLRWSWQGKHLQNNSNVTDIVASL